MVVYNGKEIDPWEFLNLPKNTDLITLKKIYKKISKKYHPDINKETPNDFFIISILSINEIKETIKKNSSTPGHKLKDSYNKHAKSSKDSLSSIKKFMKGNNFDADKFNTFFNEFKIDEPNNSGYTTKDFIEEKKNISKLTSNNFNHEFNKIKKVNTSKYGLTIKKNPSEKNSNTNLKITELGEDKISDYSNSCGKLNYTDFKLAYNGYNYVNSNENFKEKEIDIKTIKASRDNTDFKLTDNEKNQYKNDLYENNIKESQRLARLKDRDFFISEKYSDLQGKLLS